MFLVTCHFPAHNHSKVATLILVSMMQICMSAAATTRVSRAVLLTCRSQRIQQRIVVQNQTTECLFGSKRELHSQKVTLRSSRSMALSDSVCQHRFFSSGGTHSQESFGPPISSSSLPLFLSMIAPHLNTIQQLPEVQYALENEPTSESIEGLKRGLEIFAQIKCAGDEHCAVLALLAYCHASIGQYDPAQKILQELQTHRPKSFDVNLSKSKVEWLMGNFTEAPLTYLQKSLESSDVDCDILKMTSTQNSIGLISLVLKSKERRQDPVEILEAACYLLLETSNSRHAKHEDKTPECVEDNKDMDLPMDHIETGNQVATLDLIPVMENEVEPDDQIKTAIAIGFNNLGIALVVDSPQGSDPLAAWKEGLALLDSLTFQTTFANTIRVRLLLNQAILQLNDETDDSLKIASENAKKALRLSEDEQGMDPREHQFLLGRSLSVVASCFVRADSAVIAEGLFQSSVDALKKGVGPLNQLALKETYQKYANLCYKWDKRKSDGEKLEQEHDNIELRNGWKGQQELLAGLIFYGPADLKDIQ